MSVMIKCVCGKQFGVMERHIGKKGRCPHCGAVVQLEPEGGSAPAPAESKKKAAPAEPAAKSKKKTAPDAAAPPRKPGEGSAPAGGKAKGPSRISAEALANADNLVEVRTGAMPISSEGQPDVTSQMAGIRHIVQRFCPVCGARYNEGAARCSHCHAPLSKEEIAAAEAAKKPPLIPWLPQLYLSPRAKQGLVLLGILAVIGLIYLCMLPSLNRKNRLQTEFTLIEKGMCSSPTPDPLQALLLTMPGYPYDRPDTVKAFGNWERKVGPASFPTAGAGTYDLKKRELILKAPEGVTYRAIVPPVLHLAARAGDVSFVRKLLKEPGCNVDQKDTQGATALHAAAAAKGDQVEIVQLLLSRGANDQVTTDKGLTPVAVARANKNAKVVKALGGGVALEPKG